MEHVLADQGLRIRCLNDADCFDGLEEGILCDGRDECVGPALHPWRGRLTLPDEDVIVLVTAQDDERPLGLVAASQRATQHEPFVLLEAACVSPAAHDRHLLQRMIAFSILSLACRDMTPTLIAACSRSDVYAQDIRALRARFTAAVAFPDPDAPALDLAMARTARRIAQSVRPEARYAAGSGTFYAANDRNERFPQNTLVVLDLAASDEAAIVTDARSIVRKRSTRRTAYTAAAAGDWRGTKPPLPGLARGRSSSRISRPRG